VTDLPRAHLGARDRPARPVLDDDTQIALPDLLDPFGGRPPPRGVGLDPSVPFLGRQSGSQLNTSWRRRSTDSRGTRGTRVGIMTSSM
jgi:hypothetical protein